MSQSKSEKELLARIADLEKQIKSLKDRKKFGLVWEDKPEEVVLQCETHIPILKEVKNRKLVFDNSLPTNILIEGDNYHSLSVLNYTHKGKIDVIYIDPPYNTGNKDFVYNDDYVDKEDSFRHSKWISFMEKRLRLSKELLKENGIIFISIDDTEHSQLKLLCDQIFGYENFVENLLWLNKEGGGGSDSLHFKRKEEYILVYSKDKRNLIIQGDVAEEDGSYKYKDKYLETRGRYKLIKLNSFSIQYSQSLDYPIILPNGKTALPKENKERGCWRWSREKYEWGIKNGFIEFKENQKGSLWVYTKQYFKVDHNNNPIIRTLPPLARIDQYSSTMATKQLEDIFGRKPFSYPKPHQLIQRIINFIPNKKLTILDFFAGSGTTGHAVLELNKKDKGNRKFILCTNNEKRIKIAEEVTYERLKRVIKGYENKKGEKVGGLGGNLSYYKTDLVDIEKLQRISDESKIKITYQAGEMIAIRENTLNEADKNDWWQIFENEDKKTAIYFKEDKAKLPELVKLLEKESKPTVLYIFGWSKNEYKNEYSTRNIKVEDIPEPIIEVYKEINRI